MSSSSSVNASQGTTSSSGSSGSVSSPVNMQSPQSEWALNLSQIEQGLGQNTYDWANQQYGNTSALTDQTIGNYLGNAGAAQQMAGQQMNQYEQQGVPQINSLFQEANTYASPARVAQEAGAAESDASQAGNDARRQEEANLQSYGADPTSGRYAGLDEAQRMQTAASAAGAGQTAARQTVQQGQNLRSQAVAAAEQMPGEAINSLNAGYAGLSGAENAGLSNVNTGVSALGAANNFMNTASQLKYPNVGQQSSSASQQQSQGQNSSAGRSSSVGGGGGGGGGKGGGSPSGGGSSPGYGGGYGTGGGGSGGGGYGGGGGGGNYGGGNYGGGGGGGYNYTIPSDPGGYSYSGGGGGTSDFGGTSGGYAGQYYGGGGLAHGGDVNMMDQGGIPTTGGPVPGTASPSGGIQTDDIPARLNAHEFVIPQDVALWKGQEHFHKLINQSRQARHQLMGQSQAKPSMGPPAKGPPRFISAHMNGGAI